LEGSKTRFRIAVDASVLIDLKDGCLLNSFFKLDAHIFISDAQLSEVSKKNDIDINYLINSGAQKVSFDGRTISAIYDMSHQNPRLSVYDIMALFAATETNSILLTGDSNLKKLATTQTIECHGTLWLLEKMVAENIISKTEASVALQKMKSAGSYFPENIVNKFLDLWQKND